MTFNSARMSVFSSKTLKGVVLGLLRDGCMKNKLLRRENNQTGLPQEGAEKKKMKNGTGRGERCLLDKDVYKKVKCF
jgi:hypothetical protein